MNEQAEAEKEESRSEKAIKELLEMNKREREREQSNMNNDGFEWNSTETKLQVLGFLDFLGSIFGFYEAATLGNPYIALAAVFALLLGVYLMS